MRLHIRQVCEDAKQSGAMEVGTRQNSRHIRELKRPAWVSLLMLRFAERLYVAGGVDDTL
jgi:hypothetical protein